MALALLAHRNDWSLAVEVAKFDLLRDRDKVLALGGLENATGNDLVDVLYAEGLEQEDKLRLNFFSILEDLHVGHLETVDHFTENLKNTREPRVLRLENERLCAFFDDVADERDHELSVFVLEALDKQLLDVKLVTADRPVSREGQLSEELAQSLQILLDLADSARGSTDLVGDLIELEFINQEAPLEDF